MHELNTCREMWCCVEVDSRIWTRPEMRHFARHLRNSYDFSAMLKAKPEERTSWMTRQTGYREKRHFDQSCKLKLVIFDLLIQ
ncbi:hypothetical protein C0J50_12397 [Silurus asotus]|uniref:Uncharacterized protein n=1 Tax=Silurus asotus TaxID=30991 RepID=A0AAD5A0R5_SILAS|nr:hypothetical protein C0J50_12397 [Silurus asotus]